MLQKIKDTLNNSILWLMFLVGCVLWLWKKEGDAEDQLKEQKFDDSLKETKNEEVKIDGDAAADRATYERELREYNLQPGSSELQQVGAGSGQADSNTRSKN